MKHIYTTALVVLALAASVATVYSAPLESDTVQSTSLCSGHDLQNTNRWPRNIVPYTISSNFTALTRTLLMDSIHHLENTSCVLFIPRTNEQDYVYFKMSSRCCSHRGKMGPGKQDVYFSENCLQEGVSIISVLQNLIGHINDPSVVTSESDSSSQTHQEEQSSSDVSHSTNGCTDSCLSCILLQPPSGEDTSSTSGIVTSPNHPRDYPSLSDCMWKLIAPKSFFISLRFLADVNIENGKDCRFDYLDIFLLDSHEQPLVGKKRLCGNVSASVLNAELMSDVELHTQTVVIQFHSDSWYSGAGFQLGYTLQANRSDPCSINNGGCEQVCNSNINDYTDSSCGCREGYSLAEDMVSCHRTDLCKLKFKEGGCQQRCSSNNGTYHCFCKPGYRLGGDQRSCLECGGDYNNSHGVIESQNFPLPYPYEQNCKWTVHPWPDHYLQISIMHLDIFPMERCMGDFLKAEVGNFPHQSRLCGHYNDIRYVVDTSTYFRFRSKISNTNYGGFHLEYSQVHVNELSSLDRDFVTINGLLVPYDNRLWIPPSLN